MACKRVLSVWLCLWAALGGTHVASGACVGECPLDDSTNTLLATSLQVHRAAVVENPEEKSQHDYHPELTSSNSKADRKFTAYAQTGVASGQKSLLLNDGSLNSDHHTPSLVELEKFAQKVGAANYTPTADEMSAVDEVKDYLSNIGSANEVQHAADQDELNGFAALVKHCVAAAESNDGRLTTSRQGVAAAKANHIQCRISEARMKGNREEKCTVYNDMRKAGLPKNWADISTYLTSDDPDDVVRLEQHLAQSNEWLSNLTAKLNTCREAKRSHSAKKTECDSLQSTYEEQSCLHKTDNDAVCGSAGACQENADFFEERSAAVNKSEASRKSEHLAVSRILCFLGVLDAQGNKTQMADACKTAPVNDSSLTIEYPTLPNQYDCAMVASAPCDMDWVGTEYENQGWYAGANTLACKPCTPPATTTTTTTTTTKAPATITFGSASNWIGGRALGGCTETGSPPNQFTEHGDNCVRMDVGDNSGSWAGVRTGAFQCGASTVTIQGKLMTDQWYDGSPFFGFGWSPKGLCDDGHNPWGIQKEGAVYFNSAPGYFAGWKIGRMTHYTTVEGSTGGPNPVRGLWYDFIAIMGSNGTASWTLKLDGAEKVKLTLPDSGETKEFCDGTLIVYACEGQFTMCDLKITYQ